MLFKHGFKLKLTAAVLCSGLLLSTSSYAQTLKLSHNANTDSPISKSLTFFAKKVNEYTDGSVKIRIFPNGQLGTQQQSMQLLQSGALAMVKTNASELESFDPTYTTFDVPYLFKTRKQYYEALEDKDIGQKILRSSKKYGFVGIAFYDSGARNFYTTKPVKTPADLKGMKIRVQPSPSAIEMIKLLGASPTPLPFGELYTALQQGVVDGAENNIGALTTYRHGEVAKYFTLDGHTRIPDVLVISSQVWDGLSKSQQAGIEKAGQASTAYMKNLWTQYIAKQTEIAKKMGVKIIQVDKAPFIKAVKPMHEAALKNKQIAPYIKAIDALPE